MIDIWDRSFIIIMITIKKTKKSCDLIFKKLALNFY
jgi:hypothetical protein